MDAPWPLPELTRRCGEALARLGIRQENGQVAEVPNARAIRWYTSEGLLARPEQRGRVAFYGPRHLQQLVAIKRLQAGGLALATVQSALVGRSDDDIAALADLPADLAQPAAADTVTVVDDVAYRPFWAADVADAEIVVADDDGPAGAGALTRVDAASQPRVAIDHLGVTVVVPVGDGATAALPALQEAVARFVQDLVARGLLATTPASAPTTPAKENDR
jgi:DNA-binding transcriptional MerR regulator